MLFAIIIFAIVLIGCSSTKAVTKDVSVDTIEDYIKQKVSLEAMEKADQSRLKKLYHLDGDELQDFVLYTAESNVEANELAIIKVKQEEQVEVVKDKILKRIEAQKIKLQDYRPEQFYLVEKHILSNRGLYILFVVSEDAKQIEHAFNEALQ